MSAEYRILLSKDQFFGKIHKTLRDGMPKDQVTARRIQNVIDMYKLQDGKLLYEGDFAPRESLLKTYCMKPMTLPQEGISVLPKR